MRLIIVVALLTLCTVALAQDIDKRWEVSALQGLDLSSKGATLSYKLTDLGDSDRSLWGDVGGIWYPGDKVNGIVGLSTNVPWFGSTLQDNTRWCGGLLFPVNQGHFGIFLGLRAKAFDW